MAIRNRLVGGSEEQSKAVDQVLGSNDSVISFNSRDQQELESWKNRIND